MRELIGARPRAGTEHVDRPLGRGRAARPRDGATSTCPRRSRRRDRRRGRPGPRACSPAAPIVGRSACPGRRSRAPVRSRDALAVDAEGALEERRDAVVVESRTRGPCASQRTEIGPERLVGGERRVGERPRDERARDRDDPRPDPRARAPGTPWSTVFGLMAICPTTSFTVGSWSPSWSSPRRSAWRHLVDDLAVGGDAGAPGRCGTRSRPGTSGRARREFH